MTQGPDVIGSWLTLFVSAVEHYGINGPEFLAERGVDYAIASDPNYRVPVVTMAQLWSDAVAQTGDKTFGLKAGTFVTPNTFSALGVALWSSCSIRDHFNCLVRYMHVFTNAVDMSLEVEGDCLVTISRLKEESGRSPASDYAQDAVLSALITLCRSHYRHDFSPVRLQMSRARPDDIAPYEMLFGCPVEFAQPFCRSWYRCADVDVPIPGCHRELAIATEKLAQAHLSKIHSEAGDLLALVNGALTNLLPQGNATLEQVADLLHMSQRTLHRKLELRGSSFRLQIESVRKHLSKEYMLKPDLSFGDISFLLGFSSSSNFTRAFRRWNGKTPQDYRLSLNIMAKNAK